MGAGDLPLIPPGKHSNGALVKRPFSISRNRVTIDEYALFTSETGRDMPASAGQREGSLSILEVSWFDARDYIEWLSSRTGQRYRLPTEAEWEYAAQSGLFELHGNLWDWTADCWNVAVSAAAADLKASSTGDCSLRVLRGGTLESGQEVNGVDGRYGEFPVYRHPKIGFRVSRDLIP